MMKRILVPLDGCPPSESVLEHAPGCAISHVRGVAQATRVPKGSIVSGSAIIKPRQRPPGRRSLILASQQSRVC
jgi:hypothetical protein